MSVDDDNYATTKIDDDNSSIPLYNHKNNNFYMKLDLPGSQCGFIHLLVVPM